MTNVPSIRTLVIDIENGPNIAHVWQLWQTNVSLSQLQEAGELLCFAAKFVGEKKIHFASKPKDGTAGMLRLAYDLMQEADVVVTYNGDKHDLPWLRAGWFRQDWTPPSPTKSIDLYKVVRGNLKFASNKLDYIVTELGLGSKAKHEGHELWVKCMAGDPKAWKTMETYNRQDVLLTEALYERLKPWIKNLPNPALYGTAEEGEHTCPGCGSAEVKKEGFAYTSVSVFQRFSCLSCGRWSRGGKAVVRTDLR